VDLRTRRFDPDTRGDDGPADVAALMRGVAIIITTHGAQCLWCQTAQSTIGR
jgi:hypothetical protein